MTDKLIEFGTITNTFGIKGIVKVVLDQNITIENINKIKVIFIKIQNIYKPLRIESITENKNHLLIKFVNLNNINDVEKFKSLKVYCSNDDKIILQSKSLINFKFRSDKTSGIVIDYMFNKLQELIKIQSEDNKPFWVPVVDAYILSIDYENEIIIAKNIEGLK